MGNMKNQNRITVTHGDVPTKVLDFTVRDFGRLALDTEDVEDMGSVTIVTSNYTFCVAGEHDNLVELSSVMECLADHIDNVDEEELTEEIVVDDYMCVTPRHHKEQVSCHCALDDCIVANVYNYQYYAQGYAVDVYYVKEVE